jgi:hypothetical protein
VATPAAAANGTIVMARRRARPLLTYFAAAG